MRLPPTGKSTSPTSRARRCKCTARPRLLSSLTSASVPRSNTCVTTGATRWRHGYVDTWRQDSKQPFLQERSNAVEAAEVLADAFREVDRLIIVGPESAAPSIAPGAVILMTGGAYAAGLLPNEKVMAVLIDTPPVDLDRVAERFVRCATESRPLLLYSYLPTAIDVDFLSRGLPRPLPILPLLIRGGVYTHVPDQPPPSTEIFLSLMSKALNKSAAAVVTSPYSHHPR
jgi:hypothetical protein